MHTGALDAEFGPRPYYLIAFLKLAVNFFIIGKRFFTLLSLIS